MKGSETSMSKEQVIEACPRDIMKYQFARNDTSKFQREGTNSRKISRSSRTTVTVNQGDWPDNRVKAVITNNKKPFKCRQQSHLKESECATIARKL